MATSQMKSEFSTMEIQNSRILLRKITLQAREIHNISKRSEKQAYLVHRSTKVNLVMTISFPNKN